MKKLLVIILTLLLSFTTLTGCGATTFSFDKAYWQDDLTNPFENINETIVYKVKVANQTLANKSIIKNNDVSIVLDEDGVYTTKFKTNMVDGEKFYSLETSLVINGKFVIKGEQTAFSDKITTLTQFKPFANGFRAIKTIKNCENNSVYYKGKVEKFSYDYTIEYKGSTAYTVYTTKDENGKEITTKKNYEKYNEGTYIDNDLILFMPRAISLNKGVNLAFSTIDVISKTKSPMRYYGVTKNSQSFEDFSYLKNGTTETCKLEAYAVSISINEKFAGSPIEAYYAKDVENGSIGNKQKLIKLYSAINDNIGYYEYTMISASYN